MVLQHDHQHQTILHLHPDQIQWHHLVLAVAEAEVEDDNGKICLLMKRIELENGLQNCIFQFLKNFLNQLYKQKNCPKILFGQPLIEIYSISFY
jgi:uncharacterized protein YehS (DUF1456 family)